MPCTDFTGLEIRDENVDISIRTSNNSSLNIYDKRVGLSRGLTFSTASPFLYYLTKKVLEIISMNI